MPMIRTGGKKLIDTSYLRTGGTPPKTKDAKKEEPEEEPEEEEEDAWSTLSESNLMAINKTPLIEYVKEHSDIDIPDDATKSDIVQIIYDNSL